MICLGTALTSRNPFVFPALWLAALLVMGGCASDEDRLAGFMEQGEGYVAEGDTEEAIIEFKNVLQIDPNYAPAHEALSLAYLNISKPREAYWEMSETVRLDPSNITARLRFGTLSTVFGEHEAAREQAEAVLELEPGRSQAFMLRAQAREGLDDLEGAEADYLAAIKSEPDAAAYRFLYAGFLERQVRRDDVIRVLRALIDIEPSYLAFSTLGRQLAARGGAADVEAEALLRRAVEIAQEIPPEETTDSSGASNAETDTSLMTTVPREKAITDAYSLLSSLLYQRDRFDEAIAVLEEGVTRIEGQTGLLYQIAKLYNARGMKEEADATIVRATEASPDDAAPQLVLSAYLSLQGKPEGALEAAEAALAVDPENQTAQLRVAELLVDLGFRDSNQEQIDRGRSIVESILEAEPSNPEAHFVLAKLLLAKQDFQGAEQSLGAALEARPDWSQARFVLGSALAASGEVARARVELARTIELDPDLREARKLLTQVHAQLGEDEFAVEQGRAYLRQVPGDTGIRIIVGQSLIHVGRSKEAYEEISQIPEAERTAAVYFALGRLEVAFNRLDEGRKHLLEAEEMSPGNVSVLRTLLAIDRKSGDIAESAKRIRDAVKQSPNDSDLLQLSAEVSTLEKDLDGAKKILRKAIEINPRNVSAQLALADLERAMGNTDAMVSVIEGASRAMPESSDLHYRLGLLYEQGGRLADAAAQYEEAISLNDDLGQAKNNLAYLLSELPDGDLDRALELAQQAKSQLPDDPNSADTLGWVLLKRGVPSAAIGYLQEAYERFPKQAVEVRGIVGNHLAEAYEKNQEPAKAIATSEEVVESYRNAAAAAKKRGVEAKEPEWSREAEARIERLSAAG